ncbi:MAG: MBL fold metallo-hydrolase [Defluviitaleaceae bacterium]|nr:MBL fold metallo-hydrolase [Defluviitaleaceae bacterium]
MGARRIPRRRLRSRRRRKNGFSFFLVAIAILVFSLVYYFAGDLILPAPDSDAILPVEGEVIVTFLDVGQGGSIVIRTEDNAVIIDGGEHRHRAIVLDYLREAGITRLCYVVATHPHSDHIGGLITVLRDFEIGYVIMPDITNNTSTFENFLEAIENNNISVRIPSPGDRLSAGMINMAVISPPIGHFSAINDNSIVLRLEHGQTSFMFTGDAESAAENWMVDNARNLASTVLNIGHHGSRTSTTEAFLDAVNPSIAVIQVGANNQFGHPHPDVISRLEYRGIAIHRTDHSGTIRMITDGQTISISY